MRKEEAQLETVRASETSLREEVARLPLSVNSILEDQCKLVVSRGGRARDFWRVSARTIVPFPRASVIFSLSMIRSLQTLATSREGLRVRLSRFSSHDDASPESLLNARELLEAYRDVYIFLHFRLDSDPTSGLLQSLTAVAQFINQGFGAHRNCFVELDSSASAALGPESRAIIKTLSMGERGLYHIRSSS